MRVQESKRFHEIAKGGGKFRGPDWDEARRKHREKMKAKADGTSTDQH